MPKNERNIRQNAWDLLTFRTIYSYSERTEKFETEHLFKFIPGGFSDVIFRTTRIQIGKNNWDSEAYRKNLKNQSPTTIKVFSFHCNPNAPLSWILIYFTFFPKVNVTNQYKASYL